MEAWKICQSHILSILKSRFIGSHDVLGGNQSLDVVDRRKDKSTARSQVIDTTLDLVGHLLSRAEGQNVLGIHPTTPEGNVFPV